ncbi:MAG: VWA domain-containing protein [Gemmatimonadales bacterium]|nr:MAG: VWA domain-containing protein [Gemmatimonadales bacterium]
MSTPGRIDSRVPAADPANHNLAQVSAAPSATHCHRSPSPRHDLLKAPLPTPPGAGGAPRSCRGSSGGHETGRPVMFASPASAPHAPHTPHAPQASGGAALVSVDGAHDFPLEGAHLAARADGGMACSTFRQRFRNPHAEPLEVVYVLPLPADGAVLGYRITVADRVIRGEIRTREAAQKAYRDALYEGRTVGLLEQERADTFRQQVGNIPAHTAVEVEIDVLHPLAFRAATPTSSPAQWEYRFPTTVGVRYMGGAGRVPDAHRIDPDRADPSAGGTPARLTLALEVAGMDPGSVLRAPGHALQLSEDAGATAGTGTSDSRPPGRRVTATLAEPTPLDRDMVARWDAPAPGIGVHLVEGTGLHGGYRGNGGSGEEGVRAGDLPGDQAGDLPGDQARDLPGDHARDLPGDQARDLVGDGAGDDGRYALVTVVPPTIPGHAFARDLTILLDTSGSMHGLPLELGKTVVERLLRSLGGEDRFEVLTFGSTVDRFARSPTAATRDEVDNAVKRLRKLEASGCTEMRAAVAEALRPLRSDAQRQVVLVTDGYIGFEGAVLSEAMTRLPPGVRFHAVGVGAAPNRTLTGGLARAGRGLELFAQDGASAAESADLLRAASVRPVLTELVISGSALVAHAPARPRDVAEGHPVVVTVELASSGGLLALSGNMAGPPGSRPEPWRWSVRIPPLAAEGGPESGAGALPRTLLPLGALYGRERIADLELEEAAGAGRVETDARIEATALRHRIVSRRTSLVAVSDAPTVDPSEPTRRQTVAVELPAGMSAEMVGLHHEGDMTIFSAAPGLVLHERVERFDFRTTGTREDVANPFTSTEAPLDGGGPWIGGVEEGDLRSEGDLGSEGDFGSESASGSGAHAPMGGNRGASREPRRALDLGTARILRREGGALVLEFDVPHPGFHLAGGGTEVRVALSGGGVLRARVDAAASTRVGPHRAGTRVRLALRLVGHGHWPATETMRLAWDAHPRAPGASTSGKESFEITVHPEPGLAQHDGGDID